jgi:hypothetical protein
MPRSNAPPILPQPTRRSLFPATGIYQGSS